MKHNKFRAWDKKNKEWYNESNPEALTYYGFSLFGECTLLCPPKAIDLPNLIVTQWTTFQDNNKVDIYEGDYVLVGESYIGDNHHPPTTARVIFHQGSFIVDCNGISDIDYYIHNSSIKVIGNEFENPTMLGVI